MSINIKELVKASQSKMVPASAKVDSDDNRFLAPASYDKKFIKATFGDSDDKFNEKEDGVGDKDAQNFKAQDLVRKHKGAPLREGNAIGYSDSAASSSSSAVYEAYMEESYDLLEEITDLLRHLR